MSYWVVQSFAVANPAERLDEVRARLSLDDDFVTLVETGGDTHPEVLALTSSRVSQPDMSSAYDIKTDDETLFGPFVDFVLSPGEYGCVLGMNDTANGGSGHVYTKRGDGTVDIVDSVSGSTDGFGADAADECAAEYGFRPFTEPESSLEHIAGERDDPIVKYRGLGCVEPILADDDPVVDTAALACPSCGGRDTLTVSRRRRRNPYLVTYHCGACEEYCLGVHEHLLPSPAERCRRCGGSFVERGLQYPELGSTAFECSDCGVVTFDTLALDDAALVPDAERPDLVGPNVAAYREKHGVDPADTADSDAGPSDSEGSDADTTGVLAALSRLLGR